VEIAAKSYKVTSAAEGAEGPLLFILRGAAPEGGMSGSLENPLSGVVEGVSLPGWAF
jgi:hypothetical protein